MRRRSLIVLLLSALMVLSPALCAFADTEAADNTGGEPQQEAVNEEPAEDASNTKAALRGGSGEGWSSDGNSYYVNGKKVTGWKEIDGDWYYFNDNGEKQTGWQKISGKWYYFDKKEGCMLTGWQEIDGKRYYLKPAPSGAMQTGWIKETFTYDGKTITEWYYCESSGAQVLGWKKISNKWYYFEEDGEEGYMATGHWYITSANKAYLFDSNGVWQSGFSGWKSEAFIDAGVKYNKWFYYKKGVGVEGWQKINNTWYAFSEGIMLFDTWASDSSGWYYLGSDGKISKNKWAKGDDGEWYYLGSDGHPCCNKWVKDSTDWYYLDEIGCITRNDWAKDSHGWYYMGSDGKMIKNQTLEIKGVEYTFGSDGICLNPPF